MSSLSPLTIAALLASLAAHASVAMYMGSHDASPPAPLTPIAALADVDTVDLAAGAPAVHADTLPDIAPPLPSLPPPSETHSVAHPVRDATARPAPIAGAPRQAVAAATVTATPGDDSPHFAMVVGAAAVAPGGVSGAGGRASPAEGAASTAPLPADGVDQLARLVSGPPPAYPASARDSGIEADVPLDIVVDEAGHVIDVRATQHLGYGLDESATAAIRGYRFAPAMRGGRAVKVRMRWTVVFRLS